jgi:hypothetical protein
LQGLAKVGLIIGFEQLNACVLSTGSMLFVQNQKEMDAVRSPQLGNLNATVAEVFAAAQTNEEL